MNTEMMTIRQAAQTLRVREEEMPALLGQSGMQTEDGLLTRENTELLREYLADIQRRGRKIWSSRRPAAPSWWTPAPWSTGSSRNSWSA